MALAGGWGMSMQLGVLRKGSSHAAGVDAQSCTTVGRNRASHKAGAIGGHWWGTGGAQACAKTLQEAPGCHHPTRTP